MKKKSKAPKTKPHVEQPSSLDQLTQLFPIVLQVIAAGDASKAAALERADKHVERLDALLDKQLDVIRELANR